MDVLPKKNLRTRVLPGQTLPPEEIARRRAARAEFRTHCWVVFEKLRSQLIEEHYNWFIAFDPDSEEYLIDPSFEGIFDKLRESHLCGKGTIFRLNETGVCGRI